MTQLTTTLLPRPGWFLDRSGPPGLSFPVLIPFQTSSWAVDNYSSLASIRWFLLRFSERGFRTLMGLHFGYGYTSPERVFVPFGYLVGVLV